MNQREYKESVSQPTMRLLLPFMVIAWGGVVIFFLGFFISTWGKYNDNLCVRERMIQQDIEFYKLNCLSFEHMEKTRVSAECQLREHSLHTSAEIFALQDTFKSIGLCYSARCDQLFETAAFLIPLAISVPLLLFLILGVCGCQIFSYSVNMKEKKLKELNYNKIK